MDAICAESYFKEFKAREKQKNNNQPRKTNYLLSERDIKKCIQLRYGSDDPTGEPIKSWREVSALTGIQYMTIK